MTLKDAFAKLRMQIQIYVLWDKTYRVYRRARKYLERGKTLKEKGDKYRAKAEAIEELIGVLGNG